VSRVRRFNRVVTQRVGALDARFLGRARPLGEARLLWAIGAGGAEMRALRARLGLDSGYLSRLLRSLEAAGLVAVEAGERDQRVRTVRLTAAGLGEHALLDRRSDELAASLLAPLGERQRRRLRFPGGFDPARSISADALFHDAAPTEIKRMWGRRARARARDRPAAARRARGACRPPPEPRRAARDERGAHRGRRHVPLRRLRGVAPFSDEPYAHHWFEKRLDPVP
jgi:DNA-binding MarR family transcriptional regulator